MECSFLSSTTRQGYSSIKFAFYLDVCVYLMEIESLGNTDFYHSFIPLHIFKVYLKLYLAIFRSRIFPSGSELKFSPQLDTVGRRQMPLMNGT